MELNEPSAKYLVSAGFKRSEVGDIPVEWKVSTIGALAVTSSGTTPSRSQQERYYLNGTVPWVKTLDLNNGLIHETDEKVTEAALKETSLQPYPAGSVLVAMYGGYNQIGRTGLLTQSAAVNQAITAVRPKQGQLDSGYLLRVLNFRVDYWKAVASSSRKDPNITSKDVRAFPLAAPALDEQRAIAIALADADALIESLEQLLAKKRQIKQGAMQELLTGRQRLPGWQQEWARKPMGELFDFSGGVSASRDQLGMAGHAYLHYGDIHMSNKNHVHVTTEWPDLPKLDVPLNKVGTGALLADGDVVFVDASEDDEGTSKHMVVVNPKQLPFISGLHTIVAKPKTGELVDLYKRYCFQTNAVKEQFRFYAVGTKVSGVSKSNIRKISILVPSPEEQTAIATILSDMDTEITALEARLTKARQLKQGMAQALLTGRIRLV
ncbi:restriction endonuclease subunit S [Hydrogenophaga taeniospiralis]|uniref:restriction endonuclease subunit S n=1 Tax=Hydrogenophaga taeniospiralis TaxID=65656 RepID=UPI001CFB22F6|nr:restriction endonuclease subunit S [Hydrogenophaga taeniospiralis]UCU96511.1 restriction endonuclease subunit S [Hydrogenophaga taeniospiralis]